MRPYSRLFSHTFLLISLLASGRLSSGQTIQFDSERKIWLLTTHENSYALGVGAGGALRHIYWGAPLWRVADLAAPPPRRDISSFDPRQMLENE